MTTNNTTKATETKLIAMGVEIDPSTEVELDDNREMASERLALCCAKFAQPDQGWCFYVQTCGGANVLCEEGNAYNPSPSEWLDGIWLAPEQVVALIESSPADRDSKDWAIGVIEALDKSTIGEAGRHRYSVRSDGVQEDLGPQSSDEEAWDAAEEWIRAGDWPAEGAMPTIILIRDPDTECEEDLGSREIAIEPDPVALDPHGREHERAGHEHTWERPEWLGGCRENPGVWSRGGTTMAYHSVCACGCHLHEIQYGSQRNPGQMDTSEYEYPDGLWPWGEDCTEVPEDPGPASEE